jgi:hypothetical protein
MPGLLFHGTTESNAVSDHPVGTRPRNEPVFNGAHLMSEIRAEFPIGIKRRGAPRPTRASASGSLWVYPHKTGEFQNRKTRMPIQHVKRTP